MPSTQGQHDTPKHMQNREGGMEGGREEWQEEEKKLRKRGKVREGVSLG